MIRWRASLLALLLAAPACGDAPADAPGAAPEAAAPETTTSVVHFLELYRLQGRAEDVPCTEEVFHPLASATVLRNQLRDRGEAAFLVAIGDSIMPSFPNVHDWSQNHALRARAHVVLEAMGHAGVDLYVPGESDLGPEAGEILERCQQLGLRVLMSNVTVPGYEDLIEPYVIVEDNGFRVACLGITRAGEGGNGPAQATAGPVAARRITDELLAQDAADFVVVFCNVWQRAALDICKLPGVNAVIGSIGGSHVESGIMHRDGAAYMLVEEFGREIGHTTLRIVDGRTDELTDVSPRHTLPVRIASEEAELAALAERFGTDDRQALARLAMPGLEHYFLEKMRIFDENKATLEALEHITGSTIDHRAATALPISEQQVVIQSLRQIPSRVRAAFERFDPDGKTIPDRRPSPRASIPPSERCVECHRDQYDFWAGTAHARSLESLLPTESLLDVDCLRCHVTGYNEPGGYYDPRLEAPLGPVGCYECHLTTPMHVAGDEFVVDPYQMVSVSAAMDCAQCHEDGRFPGFDRYQALAQVTCPPMVQTEPPLLRARLHALEILETRRELGESRARDDYLRGRALLGLGRVREGSEQLLAVARNNADDVRLAIEIARMLDEWGLSAQAIGVMKDFLTHQMGDQNANTEYLRLLVEARDESARDPEEALRHLAFLVPPGVEKERALVAFRVHEVDALFMTGQDGRARRLLDELATAHPQDHEVRRRAERWLGETAPRR